MIQKAAIIFIFILSVSLCGQSQSSSSGIPTAKAFDDVLKHKTLNGKGFKDFFIDASFQQINSTEHIGKNLGTDNLTHFCISGEIDKAIKNRYYFYFAKETQEAVQELITQGYIADHNDVFNIYMFSSDGSHSYGSFDLYNDKTGASGRFLFRYNINSEVITDFLIPKWGSASFSTAYLVKGNRESVQNYKRPNIPIVKIMFGGSAIEILLLFVSFICGLIVLKNIFLNKQSNFGSVLSQLQITMACIGAFGVCGMISYFGSMGLGRDSRDALHYFESLSSFITQLFGICLFIFLIMLLKLKPKKYMQFWMYFNLVVIPAASIGLLRSVIKIIFNP